MVVLTVLNGADSGPGSLRDTIAASSDGDEIVFDASLTTVAVMSRLTFNQAIKIDGTVDAGKIVLALGAGDFLVIAYNGSGLELSNIRFDAVDVQGALGLAVEPNGNADAQFCEFVRFYIGIQVNNAALKLTDSTLGGSEDESITGFGVRVIGDDNKVVSIERCNLLNVLYAGVTAFDAAVTLEVIDCTISNTTSSSIEVSGPGITLEVNNCIMSNSVDTVAQVGVRVTDADLKLSNSTIGRSSGEPNLREGVVVDGESKALIESCTISNTTNANIRGFGAGVTLEVNNCIMSNSVDTVAQVGVQVIDADLKLSNSTIGRSSGEPNLREGVVVDGAGESKALIESCTISNTTNANISGFGAGVTLEVNNCVISNSSRGINFTNCSGFASNCTLSNHNRAVQLFGDLDANVLVTNNTFQNNTGFGILVFGGTNTFTNNQFENDDVAIRFQLSSADFESFVQSNTMTNCRIAIVTGAFNTGFQGRVTIDGNIITNENEVEEEVLGMLLFGNRLEDENRSTIVNTVENNQIDGCNAAGITVFGSYAEGTIKQNTIGANKANAAGIEFDVIESDLFGPRDWVAEKNVIVNNGTGVALRAGSGTLFGNLIGTNAQNEVGIGNETGILQEQTTFEGFDPVNFTVGGTTPETQAMPNVIAGNVDGLVVRSGAGTYQNNVFGTDATLTSTVLSNTNIGVLIESEDTVFGVRTFEEGEWGGRNMVTGPETQRLFEVIPPTTLENCVDSSVSAVRSCAIGVEVVIEKACSKRSPCYKAIVTKGRTTLKTKFEYEWVETGIKGSITCHPVPGKNTVIARRLEDGATATASFVFDPYLECC